MQPGQQHMGACAHTSSRPPPGLLQAKHISHAHAPPLLAFPQLTAPGFAAHSVISCVLNRQAQQSALSSRPPDPQPGVVASAANHGCAMLRRTGAQQLPRLLLAVCHVRVSAPFGSAWPAAVDVLLLHSNH